MKASKETKRESKKHSKKATASKEKKEKEATFPKVDSSAEASGNLTGKVKFKGAMQHNEATHYLEAIVGGLRKGKLQFKQGEERVVLQPNGASIRVEVKAERKSEKEKLSLELSWESARGAKAKKLQVD